MAARSAPTRGAIARWLQDVYAEAPGYLSVVTLPGAGCRFCSTRRVDEAAAYAARRAAQTNVYVSCCTLDHPPGTGRGAAADTLAMPGLWCDLDAFGPWHKVAASDRSTTRPATTAVPGRGFGAPLAGAGSPCSTSPAALGSAVGIVTG